MAHDVFISYSTKDKPAADATCAVLESKGLRCWIAPRDITPGADWGETIVGAIHASQALVLVFSANANLSHQVKREVERAVTLGLPVIPLRIENVLPAKSLEYFLSTPHWLDAFTPPLEHHLNHLADVIRHILSGQPDPIRLPSPQPAPSGIDRRVLIGGAAGGVGLFALLGWRLLATTHAPSFMGKWTLEKISVDPDVPSPFGAFSISTFYEAAVRGQKLTGVFEVGELGQYKFDWGGQDTGTVAPSPPDAMSFTSDITNQSTIFSYIVMEPQSAANFAAALGGRVGDSAIAMTAPGTAQSVLLGTAQGQRGEAIGPLVGHWYTHTPANGLLGAVTTSLDITPAGHYRYQFDIAETGLWQAADGKWTRMPEGGTPISGTYRFDNNNRVTCAAASGVATWSRMD
ncbi:MAG: toll/interleukin-1 receptor domain-containing protein [Xanthobacteraceae bacterium]